MIRKSPPAGADGLVGDNRKRPMERPCRGSRCIDGSPRNRLPDLVVEALVTLAWTPGRRRSVPSRCRGSRCRPPRSVAAGWSLLLPSRPSAVAGRVLRVFPARAPAPSVSRHARGSLVNFASSSERPRCPRRPRRGCPRSSRLPLVGFVRACALPLTSPVCVHSGVGRPPPRSASYQLANRVPPSWFLTTSTACSTARLPSLLHPGARKGSQRFSTAPPAHHPTTQGSLASDR